MYECSLDWSQSLLTSSANTLVSLCVIPRRRRKRPKSSHVDVDSLSSSHIDLTSYWHWNLSRCSSWKHHTCWVLTGALDVSVERPSLDNVCPRYCLYVAFIVCVDVKIIFFQSAAWTFIITYRNEAHTPANIVIWDILSIYNILSGCGSRESLGDCWSGGLWVATVLLAYQLVFSGARQPHRLQPAVPVH